MTLRDQLATDARLVFCNTDEFGETVVYYPHRYFGEEARASRTIKAVVERIEDQTADVNTGAVIKVWHVTVANDSTHGIASTEIDTGGDAIGVPPRDGEAAETRKIQRILQQDPGMIQFECQ